jgi:signal transduction histidine kinase
VSEVDGDRRGTGSASADDATGLSWPLVERRQASRLLPLAAERRTSRFANPTLNPTLSAAPLWPFRIAALVGSLVSAFSDFHQHRWGIIVVAVLATAYTAYACLRPAAYRNDPVVRTRIVGEQALNIIAVVLTSAWRSPFVLFFIPTGMLAGFAVGAAYSAAVSATAIIFTTIPHVAEVGTGSGLRDGAIWAALLGVVAYTTGLARRAALDSARQQADALDRVSQLAEANSLLFALQKVAQSMPASLDLDDVLDSSVRRLRSMVRHDSLAVYLLDHATDRLVLARSGGVRPGSTFPMDDLPPCLREAVDASKPVRLELVDGSPSSSRGGLDPEARSGLYARLRARGTLVGVIAVESRDAAAYDAQQVEIVHGLCEPFGIAIDNARLFQSIRTLAADEERMRIARDLHDHIGSSLALIGFEVDHAMSVARQAGDVDSALRQVRDQVTVVVSEVRDTLSDLRSDVSDRSDLAQTVTEFLTRVAHRSDIDATCTIELEPRLPLLVEREVWQMIREAVLNAERHSRARHLRVEARRVGERVEVSIADDGVGLAATNPRGDSYGLVGMSERALRIGARLTVGGPSRTTTGTEVHIELPGGSTE